MLMFSIIQNKDVLLQLKTKWKTSPLNDVKH